jgi:hypothetical protein
MEALTNTAGIDWLGGNDVLCAAEPDPERWEDQAMAVGTTYLNNSVMTD